jgi:hypothetical protein
MNLKQYPDPSMSLFENTRSVNGVLAFAQPLLDGNEAKEYFGVNLLEKNILAVYLLIKNDNPNVSFTIPAESIYISKAENKDLANNPEKDSQDAGEALTIAAVLLGGPLFVVLAGPQFSDASIIKENFEAKMFRTKTIDPGQKASGFSYFNWQHFKELDKGNICFELIDPLAGKSFPFCQNIDLRR